MKKLITISSFSVLAILMCSFIIQPNWWNAFSFKNLHLSEDGIQTGIIDLNNLDNYANQTIPTYITKDNTVGNTITDAGATLGRVLFYDKNLSSNNTIACGSCHLQEFAFNDTAQASVGVNGTTGRHAMRLVNARFGDEVKFFWDERAPTLEFQTTQPIQDHGEMGFSGTQGDPDLDSLIRKLQAIDYYNTLFEFTYGDSVITENRMQLAMAQFIRSIQSFDSKYDEGRAQANNDGQPFSNFSNDENAGKALYLAPPQINPATGVRTGGGLGCAGCHRPPEFDIDPASLNNGVVGTINNTGADFTNTKAPTLRDVVKSDGSTNGPMMHTGNFQNLNGVLNHYDSIVVGANNTNIDPRLIVPGPSNAGIDLQMTNTEKQQVRLFLRTLAGSNVYTDLKWSDPFTNGSLTVIPLNTSTHKVVENPFKVFPNPAQDFITIEYEGSTNMSYALFDLSGKMIQQATISLNYQATIAIDHLNRGVYLLRLVNENGQVVGTEKVVKL